MSPINVNRIQEWIDAGRINPAVPITMRELSKSRCLHVIRDGVKLLARGAPALTSPIHIVVSRASAAAIEAVEKAGGSVTTRYYTRPSIRRVLKGESHPYHSMQSAAMPFAVGPDGGMSLMPAADEGEQQDAADERKSKKKTKETNAATTPNLAAGFKFRLPDPTSRKDLEYYRDPAHRGYLSHLVEQGQGPSLFFRTPDEARAGKKGVITKGGKTITSTAANKIW